MSLQIEQLAVGPMQNFSYLVWDELSRAAAVVDPGWDPAQIIAQADQRNFTLSAVWLTHTHFDHVQHLPELFQLLGKTLPIFVHEAEQHLVPATQAELHATQNLSELKLGAEKVMCWHTPGHSPGGQCFVSDKWVITGDTLFVGACGRADLPGSSPRELTKSLKRLSMLPENTVVYPGHDYGDEATSTIGEEKKHNPFMQNAMRFRDE